MPNTPAFARRSRKNLQKKPVPWFAREGGNKWSFSAENVNRVRIFPNKIIGGVLNEPRRLLIPKEGLYERREPLVEGELPGEVIEKKPGLHP